MRIAFLLAAAACLGAAGCAGTPLTTAVKRYDLEEVQRLVESGADINASDKFWTLSTPLAYAVEVDSPEIAAYLVRKGARNHKDMIYFAVQRNQRKVADAMVAAGAHPRPGNLDDDAYNRMRTSAGLPQEKKEPSSDIDAPSRRGAERPDDFALVLGIEEFQNLPKADYGARDAKTVRRHLEALGFPPRNIISLTGPEATGSKLRGYLEEWLPLNVKPTSTLFVYYSGHGAPDVNTGDAYLVPWDGDPRFLKSTALPLKKLYSDLAKTKAKRIIVALDACFSGAGGRSVLAPGARPLVAKTVEFMPLEGITLLAAASGDEITGTLSEQSHGLFTYHLLKGLSADPKASAQSLFDYLKPRVQDDARRENREQTPVLAGSALSEPLLSP